jgi:hypothetical protein
MERWKVSLLTHQVHPRLDGQPISPFEVVEDSDFENSQSFLNTRVSTESSVRQRRNGKLRTWFSFMSTYSTGTYRCHRLDQIDILEAVMGVCAETLW